MNLWNDNEIFDLANSHEQYYISIHNQLLTELGDQFAILKRKVVENGIEDNFLYGIFLDIKRAMNIIATSIIPFSCIKSIDLQDLRFKFRELRILYPSIYQDFLRAAQQIKTLLEQEDNQLMKKVLELVNIQKPCKRAIVTKRHLSEEDRNLLFQMVSPNLRNIYFFNDSSYRKVSETFDEVLFIGSQSLFEAYANNCPFSKKTIFISYDIYSNYFKDMGVLKPLNSVSTIYNGVKNKLEAEPLTTRKVYVEEETPDLSSLGKQLAVREDWEANENDVTEPVEAKLITLENDHVLFLEIASKYKVVEIDSKAKAVISKPFDMLELDDCLLVFQESESEMIGTVADTEILKERAESLRSLQKLWKERLKSWVDKEGMNQVCHILGSNYKIKSSRPHNVNYWLRDTTIFSRNMEQLLIALEFDSNTIKSILNASRQIMAAHLGAGMLVRKHANQIIKDSDLKDFLTQGYQIFNIPEFPGVTFSVERIVGISSESFMVHPGKIMKLYNQNSL